MEVLVLGTGAADGWPAPFCVCVSCRTLRRRGEVRAQTSALVDDVMLLDCGPETARAATRAGRALDRVHTVLLTHEHPDHCDPSFLLWRSWTGTDEPLLVTGPEPALERCADWVGPDDPVELRVVEPGDVLTAGAHEVRVVAANHKPGSVLYEVTAPGAGRVLYATDTGTLPDATVEAMRDRPLDLLLMEQSWGDVPVGEHGTTHHTLATFGADVDRLRAVGAVTATTAVVAVHLSHHNVPEPVLSAQLAAHGAVAVPDLTSFVVHPGRTRRAVGSALPGLGARRVLVTGGARSGKSRVAERLVGGGTGPISYVATGHPADGADAEWDARVEEHRRRRPAHWSTVETVDVATVLRDAGPDDTVLVDCLAVWLTRTVDAHGAWDEGADLGPVRAAVDELVDAFGRTPARVVLVTNEVGSGVVPATPSGRLFRDLLGTLNAAVADHADEVRLVVAGQEIVP